MNVSRQLVKQGASLSLHSTAYKNRARSENLLKHDEMNLSNGTFEIKFLVTA